MSAEQSPGARAALVRAQRTALSVVLSMFVGSWVIVGVLLARLGWRRIIAGLLLWIGLASAVLEVAGVVHGLDSTLLLGELSAALICGGAAAKTRLRQRTALALLALLGLLVTGLSLSELWSRSLTVLAGLSELSLQPQRVADPLPLLRAIRDLVTAVEVVLFRLWEWGGSGLTGHYANDPVAVMLMSGFAVWNVTAWTAWSVFRRKQVAAGLAPAAVVVTGILYGVQRYPSSLLALLGTGLLLAVISAHHAREQTWQKAHVDFSEDIRLDMAVVVVPLAVIVVVGNCSIPQRRTIPTASSAERTGAA